MAGRDEAEILARALAHVPDSVEVTDASDRICYANAAFERLTGFGRREWLGRASAELLVDHAPAQREELERTTAAGSAWCGRVTSRIKNGEERTFDTVVTPIVDDSGVMSHRIAVRRDVTESNARQRQDLLADRLLTVGQLAAGVAHEINNPLSYVSANLGYLQELVTEALALATPVLREEVLTTIADMQHGAARICNIVRELQTFSTSTDPYLGPVDASVVLQSTLKLLDNEIRHRAQLRTEIAPLPVVWAERARLSQVFLNLLLNAIQSLPEGHSACHEIVARAASDDAVQQIVVEISDTGSGIASEDLPRIFDPFFTTRPVGQGTGLGLSVAHSIVTSMRGTLAVSSQRGAGTRVTVRLPRAPVQPEAPASRASGDSVVRGGQILAIDDESGVLRAIQRILRHYDVDVCESSVDALALLEERNFDLIFCDLMMPQVTGMELFAEVVASRPDLRERFVFITGGAFTEGAAQFVKEVGRPTVEKPFGVRELRALVASMLG